MDARSDTLTSLLAAVQQVVTHVQINENELVNAARLCEREAQLSNYYHSGNSGRAYAMAARLRYHAANQKQCPVFEGYVRALSCSQAALLVDSAVAEEMRQFQNDKIDEAISMLATVSAGLNLGELSNELRQEFVLLLLAKPTLPLSFSENNMEAIERMILGINDKKLLSRVLIKAVCDRDTYLNAIFIPAAVKIRERLVNKLNDVLGQRRRVLLLTPEDRKNLGREFSSEYKRARYGNINLLLNLFKPHVAAVEGNRFILNNDL